MAFGTDQLLWLKQLQHFQPHKSTQKPRWAPTGTQGELREEQTGKRQLEVVRGMQKEKNPVKAGRKSSTGGRTDVQWK